MIYFYRLGNNYCTRWVSVWAGHRCSHLPSSPKKTTSNADNSLNLASSQITKQSRRNNLRRVLQLVTLQTRHTDHSDVLLPVFHNTTRARVFQKRNKPHIPEAVSRRFWYGRFAETHWFPTGCAGLKADLYVEKVQRDNIRHSRDVFKHLIDMLNQRHRQETLSLQDLWVVIYKDILSPENGDSFEDTVQWADAGSDQEGEGSELIYLILCLRSRSQNTLVEYLEADAAVPIKMTLGTTAYILEINASC